jgi:3-methyladenine DNA glycosylase AlkC
MRNRIDKDRSMPAKQDRDNPKAFKLWISKDVLVRIAQEISKIDASFDREKFVELAPALDPLELKSRVQLVRDHLRRLLPQDYLAALAILLKSTEARRLTGFALWPYTDFIQTYGLEHPRESLEALAHITELFTAEFAVRPFLAINTEMTLAYLKKCALSGNVHLRRWASEGSRPRLPWGERLDIFIKEPRRTLEILDLLKNDDELYVRKSVANHLNDISKDHPQLVVKILKRWNKDASAEHAAPIRWITRRALRTLIKNGDVAALEAIGVSSQAKVKVQTSALIRRSIRWEIASKFRSASNLRPGNLNGSLSTTSFIS